MNRHVRFWRKYLFRRDFFKRATRRFFIYKRRLVRDPFHDLKNLFLDEENVIIFDIGANRGTTATKYHHVLNHATIHAIEPYPPTVALLKKATADYPNIKVWSLAVADTVGTATFHIGDSDVLNSLLPPRQGLPRSQSSFSIKEKQTIEVPTITLEVFCEQETIETISILKLDIQGGELAALRGAASLLEDQRIHTIYMECLIIQLYEGQPLINDLIQFLADYDYQIFNIYNLNVEDKNHQLIFCDIVFISRHFSQKIST